MKKPHYKKAILLRTNFLGGEGRMTSYWTRGKIGRIKCHADKEWNKWRALVAKMRGRK